MTTARGDVAEGQRRLRSTAPTPRTSPARIEALDGPDRYEARDWIVDVARDEGWLDGIDADRHVVPHGDRSKVAIEPYLTDQWFVDTAKIVGPASTRSATGRTRILPEQRRKVYFHWLENIEPWCISPPALVGPPDPGVVRARRHGRASSARRRSRARRRSSAAAGRRLGQRLLRRHSPRPRDEDAEACYRSRMGHRVVVLVEGDATRTPLGELRRGAGDHDRPLCARPRRPRHLVLLRPLAHRHARLARGDGRAADATSPPPSCHRLRHHLLLGRPDDDDAARRRRSGPLPHRLRPRPRPRREGQEDVEVARQRPRPARPGRRVRRRRRPLHADLDGRRWAAT